MARVLLIEDDPTQRDLRQRILETAGHEVETAENSHQAIERCAGCHVAVLDLIPNSSELTSKLPADTRVIILSGRHPQPGMRADVILRKPCSSSLLLAAIADGVPR